MKLYPESAIAAAFDPERRSPLAGRKVPRLPVVDGITYCRCGRGPVAIWSRRQCYACNREWAARRRAAGAGTARTGGAAGKAANDR